MKEACRSSDWFWSEGEPRSHLDKAGAGSSGDLAINRRRHIRSRRVEAHHVEGVRCLATQLEDEPLKVKVAEDAQIDVPVTRRTQIVTWGIAVGPTGSDTTGDTWSVGREGGGVEPGVAGNLAAAVGIEEGIDARNQVGPVVVLAVQVLVRPSHHFHGSSAVEGDDGRDGPAVNDVLHDGIAVEVVDVPHAGDAGDVALIVIHRAPLLPESVPVLSGSEAVGGLIGALECVAPDIKAVEQKVVGQRPVRRNLHRVIRSGLVGGEINVLAKNAGIVRTASVNAGL